VADPVAKPSSPAGAASPAPAAPKPIASIDDLIERAEDRLIPKGSTVRVSPENPDVQSKGRHDELEDSLEACGIKVVWDSSLAKDAIVVEAPAKAAPQAPKQSAPTTSSAKPSAPAAAPAKPNPAKK
jgi:hypothetical protein